MRSFLVVAFVVSILARFYLGLVRVRGPGSGPRACWHNGLTHLRSPFLQAAQLPPLGTRAFPASVVLAGSCLLTAMPAARNTPQMLPSP